MRVKNINGTAQRSCSCGSWIQHWRNFSGQKATVCRTVGCGRTDIVGAHVQKDVYYDHAWYIVPLCGLHNRSTYSLELIRGTNLVSANVNLTCR